MSAWLWWLCATFVLLIFEVLTGTIAALCLAVGCALSCVAALFGASVVAQALIASIGSVVAFAVVGPALKKFYKRRRNNNKYVTGMDALIGRVAVVTQEVTNTQADNGRVKIDGDSWVAFTNSPNQPIPVGEKVIIEAYDSIVLRVKPYSAD